MRLYLPTILLVLSALGAAFVWWPRDGADDRARAAAVVRSLTLDGDLVFVATREDHLDLSLFGPTAVASDRIPLDTEAFTRTIIAGPASESTSSVWQLLRQQGRVILEHPVGEWLVTVVQPTRPAVAVFDAYTQLRTATLEIVETTGETMPCPWQSNDRLQCSIADWVYVGPTQQNIAGQPHRCLWAHPTDNGVLTLTFPSTAGASRLAGWFALTDYAAGIPDGARTTITLSQGESQHAVVLHRQRGRRPTEFEVPAGDRDQPLQITFQTPRAGVRHLCWQLWGSVDRSVP